MSTTVPRSSRAAVPTVPDRRTDILDAACRAVERRGVRDLRVEDVAAEAGVSPALVYYYFGTRGALVAETFRRSNALSAIVTDARLDVTGPARSVLEQLLLLELTEARAVRQNWIVWTEMLGAALFDRAISQQLAVETGEWVATIERLLRDGVADGSIRRLARPGEVAERLAAVLDGVGTQWMLGHMSVRRARTLVSTAVHLELDR